MTFFYKMVDWDASQNVNKKYAPDLVVSVSLELAIVLALSRQPFPSDYLPKSLDFFYPFTYNISIALEAQSYQWLRGH